MRKSNQIVLIIFAVLFLLILCAAIFHRFIPYQANIWTNVAIREIAPLGDEDNSRHPTIYGDGQITSKYLHAADVTNLSLGFTSHTPVIIEIADKQPQSDIVVTAESNILQHLDITSNTSSLGIASTDFKLRPSQPIKIFIGSKRGLQNIDLSGAANVIIHGIHGKNLKVSSSGASFAILEGAVQNFALDVSGASKIDAKNLITDSSTVSVSGAGDISVYAKQFLQMDLSGAARVIYYGKPKKVVPNTAGIASITAGE